MNPKQIARNIRFKKKMNKGGRIDQSSGNNRNEPPIPAHEQRGTMGTRSVERMREERGPSGNPELEMSKERSSYGPDMQSCEHGNEYSDCPEAHDDNGEVEDRYAYGGEVDMSSDLKEEYNDFDEDAEYIAKEIMHRRAVEREKHNQSEQNYARGGKVEQGEMTGHSGAGRDEERNQGERANNAQYDSYQIGRDEDGDEELDGMHTDSDHEDDDFLSYDDKESLHDLSQMDNEKFDEDYKKDRKFAKGGMASRLKRLVK